LTSDKPYTRLEENQDVFSITSAENYVFFGCRDHKVYPYSLAQKSVCDPLKPPHFDVVSSLAMIGRGYTLVSGSRDKNLRTYNLSKDPYNE
jgi:WD40 repeat protein